MYSSYPGAKKYAKHLHRVLMDAGHGLPLHACQDAVAVAGGFRDWSHLSACLGSGRIVPVDPHRFRERLTAVLPNVPRSLIDRLLRSPAKKPLPPAPEVSGRYIDIRLAASSLEKLMKSLPWLVTTNGQNLPCLMPASHHHALDVIGSLPTGWRDAREGDISEGRATEPFVATRFNPETRRWQVATWMDSRCHANLRLDGSNPHPRLTEILEASRSLKVQPRTPQRIWAGDPDPWEPYTKSRLD